MSQKEELHEIELVDIIHFFVERWKRMFVIMFMVASIVFFGVVAKNFVSSNDQTKEKYKVAALVELPRIVRPDGYLLLIENSQLLVESYQSENVEISFVPSSSGEPPSNSLWISTEHENREISETLVMNVANELIKNVKEKEAVIRGNMSKNYSVVGRTHLVKYELIEPEIFVEHFFELKTLFKTAFLSLFLGLFCSLCYVGVEKICSDYRKKYSP